jgi:alpha-L-glutamate ligase-like protein
MRGNSKDAKNIADDKLATKELLLENGIGAAQLLGVVRDRQEVKSFDWSNLPDSFVIKPNRGLGGEGIVVILERLPNGNWLGTNDQEFSVDDFKAHIYDILDGNFSLHDTPDITIIEERLSIDRLYRRFAKGGLPDIRVIVYNYVPVMAMIRVPTKKSDGKANIAQGGVAVGIDIATGFTTHAVQKSFMGEKIIDHHPDTDALLRGVKLPYWKKILETSVASARVVGLKYCGVDISVDQQLGPVVLELNARPGLGIQVANLSPLRERLDRVSGLKVKSVEHGMNIAEELFSGEYADEVAQMTGRPVIGLIEPVTLIGKEEKRKNLLAKIDTGARTSSIDEKLARDLGYGDAIDAFAAMPIPEGMDKATAKQFVKEEGAQVIQDHPDITQLTVVTSSHGVSIRMHIRVKLTIADRSMTIEPNVYDRTRMTYPMLVGARHLSQFLIDSTKAVSSDKNEKK